MQLLGVPSQYPYGQSAVGNHSQIIRQSFIETPSGKAWFALNKRTSPAVSHSTKLAIMAGRTRQFFVPAWRGVIVKTGGTVD